MVSSIRKFAQELGSSHVVKGHVEKRRTQIVEHSVTNELEYVEMRAKQARKHHKQKHATISAPFDQQKATVDFDLEKGPDPAVHHPQHHHKRKKYPIRRGMKRLRRVGSRTPKIQMLKEEKDRFDAMREIQRSTSSFKRYSALTMSIIACKSCLSDSDTTLPRL